MLYLIGLGLGDVKDITVKGLEVVKTAHKVYLEAYTSLLCNSNSFSALEGMINGRLIHFIDYLFY